MEQNEIDEIVQRVRRMSHRIKNANNQQLHKEALKTISHIKRKQHAAEALELESILVKKLREVYVVKSPAGVVAQPAGIVAQPMVMNMDSAYGNQTPTPTPSPTPSPTPDPTPSSNQGGESGTGTNTPTPDPTPSPDPTPTPIPVPMPTPNPMPGPTPSPTPGSVTNSTPNSGGINLDAAVNVLNNSAQPTYTGNCATYVRQALAAGGVNTDGHPRLAMDYGPFLENHGFETVNNDSVNNPQRGDIVVITSSPGHPSGHIAMYNGTSWVSDTVQRNYSAGLPGAFQVYRPQQ